MSPTVIALIICLAAVALEGGLAGGGVRQRLAELRMPRYSPPFAVWLVIGTLYYAICFVILRHVLASSLLTAENLAALTLMVAVLLVNAFWSVLFFRWRSLGASFVAFVPYALLVASLTAVLTRIYPFGAGLLACYWIYLLYAIWWGYRLWRLNIPSA